MIEEKDLTSDLLKTKVDNILNNDKLYKSMQDNLKFMSIDNSSTIIYELLKNLIKE